MQRLQLLFFDLSDRLGQFLDAGGPVLLLLALVVLAMWLLVTERLLFFRFGLPRLEAAATRAWQARGDHHSWQAQQIRRAWLAELRLQCQQSLGTIRTLVAVCPFFGLLGTVTGMIAVFDVMAHSGMGNPRLMASGVSRATIPTMAGMVGALSGLFALYGLERLSKRRIALLDDRLTLAD